MANVSRVRNYEDKENLQGGIRGAEQFGIPQKVAGTINPRGNKFYWVNRERRRYLIKWNERWSWINI